MQQSGEKKRTSNASGFMLGGLLGAVAGLVVGIPVAALLGGFEDGMWIYMVPHFVIAFMGSGLWTVPLMFPEESHVSADEVRE